MSEAGEWFGGRWQRVQRAVERSRVLAVCRRAESTVLGWFGASRLVEWFLDDPEPRVIVIDLRETYTVGPVLRAAARVGDMGRRLSERTTLGTAIQALANRLRDEPVRLLGAVLTVVALVSFAAASSYAGSLWLLGVGLLLTRVRRSWWELAQTRTGRLLAAAFVPPEPPIDDE